MGAAFFGSVLESSRLIAKRRIDFVEYQILYRSCPNKYFKSLIASSMDEGRRKIDFRQLQYNWYGL